MSQSDFLRLLTTSLRCVRLPGRFSLLSVPDCDRLLPRKEKKKVSYILEADIRNFFGSLDHKWMMRFVQLRVGNPRILSLIQRAL
jgi:hypothetical protein